MISLEEHSFLEQKRVPGGPLIFGPSKLEKPLTQCDLWKWLQEMVVRTITQGLFSHHHR